MKSNGSEAPRSASGKILSGDKVLSNSSKKNKQETGKTHCRRFRRERAHHIRPFRISEREFNIQISKELSKVENDFCIPKIKYTAWKSPRAESTFYNHHRNMTGAIKKASRTVKRFTKEALRESFLDNPKKDDYKFKESESRLFFTLLKKIANDEYSSITIPVAWDRNITWKCILEPLEDFLMDKVNLDGKRRMDSWDYFVFFFSRQMQEWQKSDFDKKHIIAISHRLVDELWRLV